MYTYVRDKIVLCLSLVCLKQCRLFATKVTTEYNLGIKQDQ